MDISILSEPAFIWFLVGLGALILEFTLPGLIIIFFGVGAWIVALLLLFFPVPAFWQIAIFVVVSTVSLLLMRRRFYPQLTATPDSMDDFIGKTATVKTKFKAGEYGSVIFKGAAWKAQTDSAVALVPGQYVEIISQDSIILKVRIFLL